MKHMIHPHSPYRIFAFSAFVTLAMLVVVGLNLGVNGLIVAAVLIIIETAFSFDNAIINAKILTRLSKFWQNIFLTVGILIAVFGMRVIFPIVLVMITADLSWSQVINLAFQHPDDYAHALENAHPTISAFGGAFLLMLALHFFLEKSRSVLWLKGFERFMQKLSSPVSAPLLGVVIVGFFAALPANSHHMTTFKAGLLGIGTYMILHGITVLIEKKHEKTEEKQKNEHSKKVSAQGLVGWAAFSTFMYLEFLDASFSFDGVIGAFAITSNVALIAAGLGVGAFWVRSMTVFMVRRGTLGQYKFLDHGAHYTVLVLAMILFSSAFWHIPELATGGLGLVFITASIIASVKARNKANALIS